MWGKHSNICDDGVDKVEETSGSVAETSLILFLNSEMVKEWRLPPHCALKLVDWLPFCAMLMVPVMKHDAETRGVVDHGYPHRWAGLNSEVDDRTMRSQHPVTWYYYLSRIQSYPDCGWGCKENITSQATNSPKRPNYKATGLIQPAEGSAESQIPTTVSWQQRQWTGWWQIKGKLWKLVVALLLCVRASWQLCLEPPSSPSA